MVGSQLTSENQAQKSVKQILIALTAAFSKLNLCSENHRIYQDSFNLLQRKTLKFNTGEIGITMQPSPGSSAAGTLVQLLVPDSQAKHAKGEVVQLRHAVAQPAGNARFAVDSMHPWTMGIQAAEFLLS
jgi:hypothetical protein